MSETQSLWLVLALVYAIECIAWLRRDALGFRTWLGRRWRVVRPAQIAGNHRGGFIPVGPLPPLGTILIANPLPFTPAPEGVLGEGRVFSWDDLKTLEVANKQLRVKGTTLCRCGSNAHAAALATGLRQLAALNSDALAGALRDWLRRTLDVKTIQTLLDDLKQGTALLRWLCVGLWAYIFVIAPGVVWWRGLVHTWWLLLPALFGFTIAIAMVFRREHKRFHPHAEDERFSFFLTFLLSPASAIRAVDALSRAQLAAFHPLAVARLVCDPPEFQLLAGEAVRETRFRPASQLPADAAKIQRFTDEAWRGVLEDWLRTQGFDPEQAARPPARADESDRSYCPRCLTRFTTATGECGDCGGVALKPLA